MPYNNILTLKVAGINRDYIKTWSAHQHTRLKKIKKKKKKNTYIFCRIVEDG